MPFEYMKFLSNFGVNEQFVDEVRARLSHESHTLVISDQNLALKLFSDLILKATTNKQAGLASRLYYSQALFFVKIADLDPFESLRQSAYWQLMETKEEFERSSLNCIAILDAPRGSCEFCTGEHGKSYAIHEALENMPIPHKDCSKNIGGKYNFCRCTYRFERVKETGMGA